MTASRDEDAGGPSGPEADPPGRRAAAARGDGAGSGSEAGAGPGAAAGEALPRVPVVGFAGYSGSGKTTLVTGVVRVLAAGGVRVAAVKHAHHSFDVDQPGKDSYELRRAGAVQTLVGSRRRWALVTETDPPHEPTLDQLVDRLDLRQVDVVLVEGFKHSETPKIAVARGEELPLVDDPFVVAVATPGAAAAGGAHGLPCLDLDRPDLVARFITERFLSRTQDRTSTPPPAPPPTPAPTP